MSLGLRVAADGVPAERGLFVKNHVLEGFIQKLADDLYRHLPESTGKQEAARRRVVIRRAFARLISTQEGRTLLLRTLGLSSGCPKCGGNEAVYLGEASLLTGREWWECRDCKWHYEVRDGRSIHPDCQPDILIGKGTQPDPRARQMIEDAAREEWEGTEG